MTLWSTVKGMVLGVVRRLDSQSGSYRVVKGGGWIGNVSNNEISFRGEFDANGFGPDQGFRIARRE
ncbi:Sulfatase-modifying factor enzyme 1 [Paenibacillus sp. cl130]|nr:Sulfatase-modifying factor enzyme 1 [Paenibacillus sp. cl130]